MEGIHPIKIVLVGYFSGLVAAFPFGMGAQDSVPATICIAVLGGKAIFEPGNDFKPACVGFFDNFFEDIAAIIIKVGLDRGVV